MKQFINIKVFLISLSLGFLFVYLMGAHKKIVHIYPSPENWEKVVIQDKSQSCYKYVQNNVDCPSEDKITQFPIQN